MQTIGLCRFSYPAIGGFQVEHETIDERIAYLYAEDRLEERFRLMETVALPCLREQTDGDFDLILVIGDSLPAHHRDRLHDLVADMPQVSIQAHEPRPQRELMKEILNRARRYPDEPCLQFRHDDDDAVAVTFIEKLREAVDDCAALCARHRSVAFDFNRGHIAEIGAAGIAATDLYRPFYVAALGMHIKGRDKLTIMNFMHERIPQFMPCVTFTKTPMFVRTHNGFNDSRQKKVKPVEVTPLDAAGEARFRTDFAIDADLVRKVYSAES